MLPGFATARMNECSTTTNVVSIASTQSAKSTYESFQLTGVHGERNRILEPTGTHNQIKLILGLDEVVRAD